MGNRRIFLIVTAFLFMLSACGGGDGHDAPAEATITINPPDVTVTVEAGALPETKPQHFLIVVKDENGIPLRDVELTISYPWAAPSSNFVVQLYDGSSPENSPMTVKTDENGAYDLRFDYMIGNDVAYKGDVQVTSGSLFASASFAVEVEEAAGP